MSPNVSDPEGERPGRKQRFLLALLTAPTIEEACKAVSIDRRTGYRWRQEPKFRERLDELRRQTFDHAITRIQAVSTKAVSALERSLDCGLPSAEISAAGKLLDLAAKCFELHDLARRVDLLQEERDAGANAGSRLEAYLE